MSKRRKQILRGDTIRVKTGCGWLYTTLNLDGDNPAEIFLRLGKSGGCTAAFLESIQRICNSNLQTSMAVGEIKSKLEKMKENLKDSEKTETIVDDILKHIVEIQGDLSIDELVKQFNNVLCPSPGLHEGVEIKSCPDGVALSLAKLSKKELLVDDEKKGDDKKK